MSNSSYQASNSSTTFVHNGVAQPAYAPANPHQYGFLTDHTILKVVNKPILPSQLSSFGNINIALCFLPNRGLFLRRNHSTYPWSIPESLAWGDTA